MSIKILLLQGPVGPFFRNLSDEFKEIGHIVYKVNFNAGDRYFYPGSRTLDYKGTPESWAQNLRGLIRKLSIDRIYVFGDCRFYHAVARDIAREEGVRYFVFEEGYLRPDYITLEEDGVNGHTNMSFPDDNSFFKLKSMRQSHHNFKNHFFTVAWYAIQYYLAACIQKKHFPEYHHHRPLNVPGEGSKWILSGWRKLVRYWSSRKVEKLAANKLSGKYYMVPLQVHVDMQVLQHSSFRSVEEFITLTLESFSLHAPDDLHIIIKHHPMDRGYRDYTALIRNLAEKLGLQDRVIYVFDSHLPTLLKHALGTVTINSTVGLSSLHHGVPVKPMGSAIYDIEGLSFQGSIDEFWRYTGGVDQNLYKAFRQHLLDTNQVNGNFYQKPRTSKTPTGLAWTPFLGQQHFSHTRRPDKHTATRPVLIKNSAA